MWRSATGRSRPWRPTSIPALAAKTVDVSGLYVTPGLIDIHVHVYHTREPEGLSVMADSHSFRSGVTTMVDTGTAGARNFLHFKRTVIDLAKTRIFAYVNIVDLGMIGDFEQDVRTMDPELAASVVMAYPDVCVGVKTAHYWTRAAVGRGASAVGRGGPGRGGRQHLRQSRSCSTSGRARRSAATRS